MGDRQGVELVELVANSEAVEPDPDPWAKLVLVLGTSFLVHWPAKDQLASVQLSDPLEV